MLSEVMFSVMTVVLSCLAIQRFANIGGFFHASWFEAYIKLLSSWLAKLDNKLAVILIVLPVWLALAVFQYILSFNPDGYFNPLLYMLLYLGVMFVCIDARSLKVRLASYFSSLEKDEKKAALTSAADFIGCSVKEIQEPEQALSEAVLLKSFENIFVGIFCFMFFGIYGLTLYFLMSLLEENILKISPKYAGLRDIAVKVRSVLEWIPSRILGITFALAGSFGGGFGYFVKNMLSGLKGIHGFVVGSGFAALGDTTEKNQIRAAIRLVDISLIVWLVVLSCVFIQV